MDRIREASRRGNMTAVNGGLTKRRQRSSNLRDSPEEDGAMEMQETGRLRDRGGRKDKDRDRSSRNKRRRGDRMMHGSHREDGEESSEESVDEEEDEEEDDSSVSVRLPLPPVSNPSQSASMMQSHHLRKGYAAKPVRPPGTGTWKVVEEMIGASIPRKARSSAVKRSPECWVSSGGGGPSGGVPCGGVGGEQVHWPTSTSPVRPILSSTTPVSPSSSNASIRKKMKTISGTKHRPPKTSKSSSIQEIEIEVAEVLFGMTRQAPLKKDNHKNDSKEFKEVKSRVSSPIAISSPPRTSQSPTVAISNSSFNPNPLTIAAPKRKRPRMRFEAESPSSTPSSVALPATPISSAVKLDKEAPLASPAGTKTDPNSPASEKNMSSPAVENGGLSGDPVVSNVCTTTTSLANSQPDLFIPAVNAAPDPKDTDSQPEKKTKEEVVSPPKESLCVNLDLDVNLQGHHVNEAASVSDNPRKEKFNIDLMAPAPAKSSLEKESTLYCVADHKSVEMEKDPKLEVSKGQKEKMENKSRTKPEEIAQDCRNTVEPDSKKQAGKDMNLDLQLDLEKHDKDVAGASKHHAQKQQPRGPRAELRTEKAAESLPLPMQIPGWPASFPPFGYIGQVPLPPFGPVDASISSSKTVQSLLPSRPKRCATHCYIAQNILYHQQMTRLNPYWPSAVGAAPFYASKQYNLSNTSLSDSAVLGNPMQGSLPCRNLGSVQEKEGPVVSANSGLSTKDKNNAANTSTDSSQKKPPMLQQSSQPGSAGNMLAPAFIFPLNQQQAATVGVCTANRSAVAKLTAGSSNATQSSSGAASATVGIPGAYGPGTTMSFNCPGMPLNEAQCLAFLQNNTYQFPIPAHVGGAPPYRGATPAQAMPFFNVSFYPPQMLHPSQLRLPLPQQPPSLQPVPCSQQGHQNISTSSGSSSSPKNTQQSQRIPTAAATSGNSRGFPRAKHQLLLHQAGQLESEVAREDTPSTADSRASQVHQDSSSQKYAIPAPTQNFTLISPAKASLTSGGSNHSEKLQQPIHNKAMKMDLTQSQALAMSFASFGGAAASSGAAMQGLDFSSMAQNHALFQSLPEAARHNFHISAAAAAAVHAAQQQQHKKPEVGKSASDLCTSSIVGDDGKISSVSNVLGSVHHQHSLVLARPEAEPPISSVISNTEIDSSSRNLNLIQQPSNGAPRISSRPSNTAPAPNSHNLQQQQHLQQVLQLQRQHQQLQQQQQQQRAKSGAHNNNAGIYTDRLPGSSNASKFPQALAGFPSALIQNSSSSQSPQWKASPRTSAASSSAALSPSSSSSVKNQISLQNQVRSQTHISFGVSPAKVAGQAGQQHLISSGSINPASVATITVNSSPHALVSKNSGASPLSSSSAVKTGPSPVLPSSPLQKQQQLSKNSSSTSSSITPLATTNRNMPSILGTPHTNSASNSTAKSQSSSSLHQPAKQHLPQAAQFFFSNPYMQNQTTPSDAAAVSYFQQHSQRPSQLKEKSSSSTGILSLGSASSATAPPDPSKAAEAAPTSNSKGLMPSNRLLQPGSGTTTTTMHPLMPAPASFPYMHSMPSVSLKPVASSEQKPAAGNDNLHACWQQQQPEKR